jgi:hypothetical protein
LDTNPMTSVLTRERKGYLRHQTLRRNRRGNVNVDTENTVMHLQANEHQVLPERPWMGQSLPPVPPEFYSILPVP